MSPTDSLINVSLLAYVYVSILCLVYVLPFKIHLSTKVYCKHTCLMSHQKTTVTQQKEHKFDILAVSRLIKGMFGMAQKGNDLDFCGDPDSFVDTGSSFTGTA